MISRSLLIAALNEALSTGGDYAEIFYEDTDSESLLLDNGKSEPPALSKTSGVGIRILKGLGSVYGTTSDFSKKSLLSLAADLAKSFEGERIIKVEAVSRARVGKVNRIPDPVIEAPLEEKLAYLRRGYEAAKEYDERLVRIMASLSSTKSIRNVVSASGPNAVESDNVECRVRLSISCVASDGKSTETGRMGPGLACGWKQCQAKNDPAEIARKAAKKAITMLSAKECPSGRYPVIIANGWGGVLFHESCGHPLEASATSRNLSIFSNCIGKQIASPIVSAFDDGTIGGAFGSSNIDDEGVETHKNQLIKDGICVGYLVDRFNGRRLNMEPNGTSRRQSYRYAPTSRMSNTYIAAGKDNPEDIVKDTKLGIYVADFGGGSVDPSTGEFNFSACEAYIVRDGKIAEPVKGCTLIGRGDEVLMNIDRVGNDLDLGQGYCGAASGSIPVCVGQPTIRLKEITVGGRGGKLE